MAHQGHTLSPGSKLGGVAMQLVRPVSRQPDARPMARRALREREVAAGSRLPYARHVDDCTLATRGVYQTDPEKFHFAAYDNDTAPWGATARQTWREVSSRPFIAGLFIWTGFDYRGEPSPHGWPCVNSHFGLMDMCGFQKDSFYLHKAYFNPITQGGGGLEK